MSAKENILALDQKLSAQRNEWSNNIKNLAQNLRKLNGLEEVIADVLSSRQTLVDQMAYLNMKVKEQKSKVASRYRTAYIKYYEYDYKLGEKQKESSESESDSDAQEQDSPITEGQEPEEAEALKVTVTASYDRSSDGWFLFHRAWHFSDQ